MFTDMLERRHLLRCDLGRGWNVSNKTTVREKDGTGMSSIFLLISPDSDSMFKLRVGVLKFGRLTSRVQTAFNFYDYLVGSGFVL